MRTLATIPLSHFPAVALNARNARIASHARRQAPTLHSCAGFWNGGGGEWRTCAMRDDFPKFLDLRRPVHASRRSIFFFSLRRPHRRQLVRVWERGIMSRRSFRIAPLDTVFNMSRRSFRVAPLDTGSWVPGSSSSRPCARLRRAAACACQELGDQAHRERRFIPRAPDEHRLGSRPPLCKTAG